MVDDLDDGFCEGPGDEPGQEVDDGVDTVRGGPEPVSTLHGIVAAAHGMADLSYDVTRRDSPAARQRRDARLPSPGDGARYRFGELLGEGGKGEVLLAHDEHIGRERAVKRIRTPEPPAQEL